MTLHILNNKHGMSAQKQITESVGSLQRKKQRRHELWILSCYVELSLVEEVVLDLRKSARITKVYLAFNFAEIYRLGPTETQEALAKLQAKLSQIGVAFEWAALAASKLVHGKAYAVIQRSGEQIADGLLLTTSANFTRAGFKGGNVELGYMSTLKKDLREFERTFRYLERKLKVDIGAAVLEQGSYLLKFAILSSGQFLHKWSGSLSQHIGIRYLLTPEAQAKGSIAPELANLGFKAGNTFTRQVLDLGELPQKAVPRAFMTRYTIETYWGRWCPSEAWDALIESYDGAEQFIDKFRTATTDGKLRAILKNAAEIQQELIKQGLIHAVDEDHLLRWEERIVDLRSNLGRLKRFSTGYEAHPLPYSMDQDVEVMELFENVEEAISLSKAINLAKEKVQLALEAGDPALIKMDAEDAEIIRQMKFGE